jgi:hypothetical protein
MNRNALWSRQVQLLQYVEVGFGRGASDAFYFQLESRVKSRGEKSSRTHSSLVPCACVCGLATDAEHK